MATSLLLRVSILLGILALSATARPGRPFHPCHTLILFSSSSSFPRNDAVYPHIPTLSGPRSITVFFTQIRPVNPTITFETRPVLETEEDKPSSFPLGLYSSVGASFRDRTKDILRVVGSLLFGVGCGALTAATLYLIWSLFAPNRFEYESDESDGDFDDVSPKKARYVAIPTVEKPTLVKEVV